MERTIHSKNSKYLPLIALNHDIPQINQIVFSFWGEKSIYDNDFYYRILKDNLSFVYRNNNEVIAVCLLEKLENNEEIMINLLCVKKEYQRKGLGKSLLDFCIKNCVKKGYCHFYLHVATTNKIAINLYKKFGFYGLEYIPNYYESDMPPDNNAFLLKLEIDNNKK